VQLRAFASCLVLVLVLMLVCCRCCWAAANTEEEAHSKPFVASMGMYVIKRKVLQELLSTRFPRVRRALLSRAHGLPELHTFNSAHLACISYS
jgi:hypothetical protein